jgi:hypothetical protein
MYGPPTIFPVLPLNEPGNQGTVTTVSGTVQSQFQASQPGEVFAGSLGIALGPPSPASPTFVPPNATQAASLVPNF